MSQLDLDFSSAAPSQPQSPSACAPKAPLPSIHGLRLDLVYRNREIVADHLRGHSQEGSARKHGLSQAAVSDILCSAGFGSTSRPLGRDPNTRPELFADLKDDPSAAYRRELPAWILRPVLGQPKPALDPAPAPAPAQSEPADSASDAELQASIDAILSGKTVFGSPAPAPIPAPAPAQPEPALALAPAPAPAISAPARSASFSQAMAQARAAATEVAERTLSQKQRPRYARRLLCGLLDALDSLAAQGALHPSPLQIAHASALHNGHTVATFIQDHSRYLRATADAYLSSIRAHAILPSDLDSLDPSRVDLFAAPIARARKAANAVSESIARESARPLQFRRQSAILIDAMEALALQGRAQPMLSEIGDASRARGGPVASTLRSAGPNTPLRRVVSAYQEALGVLPEFRFPEPVASSPARALPLAEPAPKSPEPAQDAAPRPALLNASAPPSIEDAAALANALPHELRAALSRAFDELKAAALKPWTD